jgi:organic hydroperoxide reductase OsmC/OhrA
MPREFDGPGNQWTPESLLAAAVADCFVLSFRAVAVGLKFSWVSLDVRSEGTVKRSDGKRRFTKSIQRERILQTRWSPAHSSTSFPP